MYVFQVFVEYIVTSISRIEFY